MTAPNIEMIASSLRNCSLNGGGGARRGRRRSRPGSGGEGSDDSEGVTVELNSEVALPYHWEQCLDIRTGQVYYINWEDGTRTTVDPRTSALSSSSNLSSSRRSRARRSSSSYSSGSTSFSSAGAVTAWYSSANGSGYDNGYTEDVDHDDVSSTSTSTSRSSGMSSTLSSFSPTDESASGSNRSGNAGHVLVAAGCRACFMYFMVPKRADVCPKCGSSGLLHLGRNGYV